MMVDMSRCDRILKDVTEAVARVRAALALVIQDIALA